jgi:hypothetical protein
MRAMDKPILDCAPDPYDGVELGVECAWPSAQWQASDDDGAPAWPAQYTVSTGTPNT